MTVGVFSVYKCDVGISVSDGGGIRIVMKKYKCCIIDNSVLNTLSIDDAFIKPHSKGGDEHSWTNMFFSIEKLLPQEWKSIKNDVVVLIGQREQEGGCRKRWGNIIPGYREKAELIRSPDWEHSGHIRSGCCLLLISGGVVVLVLKTLTILKVFIHYFSCCSPK